MEKLYANSLLAGKAGASCLDPDGNRNQLDHVKPVYGVVALAVAGVLTAFSDSFKSFVVPQGITIAGLLLVAGAVLSYVASPENGGVFSLSPGETGCRGPGWRDFDHDWRKLRMGSGATAGLLVFSAGFAGHLIGLQAKSRSRSAKPDIGRLPCSPRAELLTLWRFCTITQS